jgi:hypothetical protein
MANINKFSPVSPDTFLKAGSDMALAKFGHLNTIVDAYNTLDTSVTTLTNTVSNGTIGTVGIVTQITDGTTAVIVNASKGVITTFALTNAAGAINTFTVTNSFSKTTSIINLSIQYANGKTGYPSVLVDSITNGSFNVRVANLHASAALNDVVKIHFTIS